MYRKCDVRHPRVSERKWRARAWAETSPRVWAEWQIVPAPSALHSGREIASRPGVIAAGCHGQVRRGYTLVSKVVADMATHS